MKTFYTRWDENRKILETRLSGEVNTTDIKNWSYQLVATAKFIPDNTEFKMLVNLCCFEPGDLITHKEFRTVIPKFLLQCGYSIGYLKLLPAESNIEKSRSISCVKVATVHHDEKEMSYYNRRFESKIEKYFIDETASKKWLIQNN